MSTDDHTGKGKIMRDLTVFFCLPTVQNLLHTFPGRAIDQGLMDSLVGFAGIIEIAHVDAFAQDLVQCRHGDFIPTDPKPESLRICFLRQVFQ